MKKCFIIFILFSFSICFCYSQNKGKDTSITETFKLKSGAKIKVIEGDPYGVDMFELEQKDCYIKYEFYGIGYMKSRRCIGEKTDSYKEWFEDGQLSLERLFINDTLVVEKSWNEEGKIIKDFTLKKKIK